MLWETERSLTDKSSKILVQVFRATTDYLSSSFLNFFFLVV